MIALGTESDHRPVQIPHVRQLFTEEKRGEEPTTEMGFQGEHHERQCHPRVHLARVSISREERLCHCEI